MSSRPSAGGSPIGSTAVCCAAPTRGSSCGFAGAAGSARLATSLGWYYQRQGAALGAVSVSLVADKVRLSQKPSSYRCPLEPLRKAPPE